MYIEYKINNYFSAHNYYSREFIEKHNVDTYRRSLSTFRTVFGT